MSLLRPAQQADTTERHTHVAGAVTITNKGISLIPAFTLGKPAAIVDVAITDGAMGFEPQFRLGLSGKPWSFIFWGRYRPLRSGKFRLGFAAHPAVLFRTTTDATSGVPRETIVVNRYLAGEVNSAVTLGGRNLALAISAMVNKTIRTRITVGGDFLWNVSLIYFLR